MARNEVLASDFGIRLRRERQAANLTLKALAELTGMSDITIRRIERGERKEVTLEQCYKLAGALGCDPEYLAGWTTE